GRIGFFVRNPIAFDYSRAALPDLVEQASLFFGGLFERVGIQDGNLFTKWYCLGGPLILIRTALGNGPIDWNCDGTISAAAVTANINNSQVDATHPNVFSTLKGFEDWSNLRLD